MRSVSDMTTDIRTGLADEDGHRFTDAQVLSVLNRAARRVHRQMVRGLPELLMSDPVEGTTTAGTAALSLDSPPQRILSVHVDERELKEVRQSVAGTYGSTDTARPHSFYLKGWQSVNLVPTPDAAYSYRIVTVPRFTALTASDSTAWPDDFDDALVEYVAARLGIVDEGDASQEMQMFSDFTNGIDELLGEFAPRAGHVSGYWDVQPVNGDY